MIKKSVAISLFIFFVFSVAVVVAGLLSHQNNQAGNVTDNTGQQTGGTSTSGTIKKIPGVQNLVLSISEIAKHNSQTSCWLLVSGKVYDVTSSIGSHPGGAQEILKFCGKDGTLAFETKDSRGNDHSSTAYKMLAQDYIGDLNQTINKTTQSSGTTGTGKTTSQTGGTASSQNSSGQNTGTGATSGTGTINVALTLSELAKHNSQTSCWLLISGKIYNVTNAIGNHPGGANEIIKFCGTDATVAFQTKDARGSNHSSSAYAMLAQYYIGDLNQSVSGSQTTTAPAPVSTGRTRGGDDD